MREAAAVAPRGASREREKQQEEGGGQPDVAEERREARRQPQQVEECGAAHVCARRVQGFRSTVRVRDMHSILHCIYSILRVRRTLD